MSIKSLVIAAAMIALPMNGKRHPMIRRWLVPGFALALLGSSAQAAVRYSMTDLGDLPGGGVESRAYGVNDAGQVVGYGYSPFGYRAFLWTAAGGMQELGLGPGNSEAYGVNNAGQVVGSYTQSGKISAFLWTAADGRQDLGIPGGDPSIAYGLNEAGHVVGYSSYHAFLWTAAGGLQDPGDLPGGSDFSLARDVNVAGQVVGYGAAATGSRAFLWTAAGGMQDLGDLPGGLAFSFANGINDAGQIVGYGSAETGAHAFLWTAAGGMQDLGVLPGDFFESYAYSINDAGQIVGSSYATTGTHAFLWTEADGLVDLNSLVDPSFGWTLSEARAINTAGQIVGWGRVGGETHAYLLTPVAVPEPATWAMLIAGFGMAGAAIRRRRSLRLEVNVSRFARSQPIQPGSYPQAMDNVTFSEAAGPGVDVLEPAAWAMRAQAKPWRELMTNHRLHRKSFMAVGGMALALFLSSQASAMQTYYGALTIVNNSLTYSIASTYSITTDGTLGAINAGNITSWNVTMSTLDGVEVFSNTTPGAIVSTIGSSVSATSTDLLFDYERFPGYNLLEFCTFTCRHYLAFENNGGIDYASMRFNLGVILSKPQGRVQSIASVHGANGAVPEPGTWAMVILGFGLIGGAQRRRRAKWARKPSFRNAPGLTTTLATALRSFGVALALTAMTTAAQAAVVTFDPAPYGAPFGSHTEDGFTVSTYSGYLFNDDFGSPGKFLEPEIGVGKSGGVAAFLAVDGSPFTFSQLDYALYTERGAGAVTLSATGFRNGVTVGTESFALAFRHSGLQFTPLTTFRALNLAGIEIDELRIALDIGDVFDASISRNVGYLQALDNVTFGVAAGPGPGPGVPEPATWAMLVLGFGLMGAAMRRRAARLPG